MSNPELERLKREAYAQEQARVRAEEDAKKRAQAQGIQDGEAALRRELSTVVYDAIHGAGSNSYSISSAFTLVTGITKNGRGYRVSIFNGNEWSVEGTYPGTSDGRMRFRGNLGDGSLQKCLLLQVL